MEIKSVEFVMSNKDVAGCPPDMLPEYAFIGRSNVGKSSLINMLAGRKGLAMTSATPGKTLLINHFIVNKKGIIEGYVMRRMQMTCLFVLVDARHEPQAIDLAFIHWLGENGVPFAIVFTKADKLKTGALNANVRHYLDKLGETWEELPPHFVTSSEKKTGRQELLAYIEQINESLKNQ